MTTCKFCDYCFLEHGYVREFKHWLPSWGGLIKFLSMIRYLWRTCVVAQCGLKLCCGSFFVSKTIYWVRRRWPGCNGETYMYSISLPDGLVFFSLSMPKYAPLYLLWIVENKTLRITKFITAITPIQVQQLVKNVSQNITERWKKTIIRRSSAHKGMLLAKTSR